ncbi:ABC transporter ATP-binding protein [Nocardioides soli]|uniref:Branched-chain amino acid transport system ATP-binding protein n=1 Tax=Nocardioides soli TaxID=1036020 RepID=A0A7W4W149_9ACTN|nr:ABC transporter ATP-binding protein [Nocardioides soli]MBB3045360.1 branched-chain amino acid transport system ATP-binding protein [Nocardioides soli]
MLRIDDLVVRYGAVEAVNEVSLTVAPGELVALLGANGAGKTTLLRTVSGLVPANTGAITFEGIDLRATKAEAIAAAGIAHVPEGRRIFGGLSVEENLILGATTRGRDADLDEGFARVYELFPVLQERRNQGGWSLSGGQQQMLAIGRALMSRPRLLMLDEPSLGLAPILVRQVLDAVRSICDGGTAMLLVEQNARAALRIADRAVVLDRGRVAREGAADELADDQQMRALYLGA